MRPAIMSLHPVQCRDLADMDDVIQACIKDHCHYKVDGLMLYFWW